MLKIVALITVAFVLASALDINNYIDYWCFYNNGALHNETIPLPQFHLGEGFFTYDFRDGKLGDFRSLNRKGSCGIRFDNGTAVLTLHLGLKHLWAVYENCIISNPLFTTEARINVTSSDNAARLVIGIDYRGDKESCSVSLHDSKIERLEIDNISVKGFGVLDFLFGWISKKILYSRREEFIDFMNHFLKTRLQEIFKDYDICEKIKQMLEGKRQ